MVRVIICHQLNTKNNIISGSEVSRLSVAIQNNSREKYSFKGNGWNNGVGVSAQYNKQHTFYLEADYTQSNLFDQKQVNGGYRFSF